MITLATQVEGHALFFEKKFESRLYFVDHLIGMVLLGAALCATGKSTVQNANTIERGYERVEEKLLSLGARITHRA